jgi:hypothetical protein
VDEDASGLTFEEWDHSVDTDPAQDPVAMIVISSDLCVVDFDLREVIPLHLESVVCGDQRTCGAVLKQIHGMGTRRMYSPWITTMNSGHDVSEYELGASGLPPMFHHNNRAKNHQKSRKIMVFLIKKNSLCGSLIPGGSGDFHVCRIDC